MKMLNRILITLCLAVLSLPAICQHYYDSAGHVLAYEKGVILYNAAGKKLGHIWPGGFKDTSEVSVVKGYGGCFFFSEFYKYNGNMGYGKICLRGQEIYAGGPIIGNLDGYRFYDTSGAEVGYTDKAITTEEAAVFYFLLLPNWGGRVP